MRPFFSFPFFFPFFFLSDFCFSLFLFPFLVYEMIPLPRFDWRGVLSPILFLVIEVLLPCFFQLSSVYRDCSTCCVGECLRSSPKIDYSGARDSEEEIQQLSQ